MALNYYTAKIFVRRCLVDIRINDVPLMKQNVDGDISTETPINFLIESKGQQLVSLQIYPNIGSLSLPEGATCSVEIWRYDGRELQLKPLEQICSLSFTVDESNKMLPTKYETKTFFADVAYQIRRWSDCEVIDDNRLTRLKVTQFFQNIAQMLSSKLYGEYSNLIYDRESNVCTALSLEKSRIESRNQELIKYLNDGFVYCPPEGKTFFQYYADGRVVTILDSDMRPALQFVNEETGEALALDILLGIKRGQRNFSVI